MSADTLTANGQPVALAAPSSSTGGFTAASFAVVSGAADEIAVAWISTGAEIDLSGYSLGGTLLFQHTVAQAAGLGSSTFTPDSPSLATDPGEGVVITWHGRGTGGLSPPSLDNGFSVVAFDGAVVTTHLVTSTATDGIQPAQIYSTVDGFALQWADVGFVPSIIYPPEPYRAPSTEFQRWNAAGSTKEQDVVGQHLFVFADISLTGQEFSIQDNQAQLAGQAAVTVPGEPAAAMTQVVAASLADGHIAAVAWVDSGTDYVSLYDAVTNSFGARIGLDWGGAGDLHVVALPDGGFAVSWANGGAYKGELFDGAGNGGGIMALTGQFAAIDSHGDLYTVGLDSSGNEVVQTYAINGGSSGGGGTGGQTFNSDDNGDVWVGTAENDIFNLGRGGDWVTGNGGNDTYRFAGIPWAGGHITDFNADDVLDLTGLMSTTSDTGPDGFADGYLKITQDSSGNAQVWADYHIQGNDGWWLVETLDGVSASSLTHTGDVITVGSSSGSGGGSNGPMAVSTSDSTYAAPNTVNSITLTGSQQTVTANNAWDTTIWSNDTGNAIHGGAGDDTIHIGRGGDWVDGGAGKDVFVFDDIPWAPATIAALYPDQGDTVDVSGILAKAGYAGSDPIADGYLKISGNQIFADYHLPGNDGWWQVATVYTPGMLQYAGNGVIDDLGEHVGGTVTVNGQPGGPSTAGADTVIETGSNLAFTGNDGGDTLIDQGSNNEMFGGKGNDTLVLGTSTTVASDGWGGDDTWVLNPQSSVITQDIYGLYPGDRLDVRALLSASGYTGSDPVGDGYVFITNPPAPAPGEMGDFRTARVMYDPDGFAGPAVARPLFDMEGAFPNQFHYSDGFFVVG